MKKLIIALFIIGTSNVFAQTTGGGVTDIEGNNYATVWIGGIEWMSENLRTKTYNNGTIIPTEVNNWGFEWSGLQCTYNNDIANESTYGILYNHFVVDNVCPTGWHVPTMVEIGVLKSYVGMSTNNGSQYFGGSLKSTGTIEASNGLWNAPNVGATNTANFNAHPAGIRSFSGATYQDMGNKAIFWTQEILEYNCSYGGNSVALHDCGGWWSITTYNDYLLTSKIAESAGLSIRCVNDINQVGLIELKDENSEKVLIKIIDIMGRETTERSNVVLIYIYSDGSRERIFNVRE